MKPMVAMAPFQRTPLSLSFFYIGSAAIIAIPLQIPQKGLRGQLLLDWGVWRGVECMPRAGSPRHNTLAIIIIIIITIMMIIKTPFHRTMLTRPGRISLVPLLYRLKYSFADGYAMVMKPRGTLFLRRYHSPIFPPSYFLLLLLL